MIGLWECMPRCFALHSSLFSLPVRVNNSEWILLGCERPSVHCNLGVELALGLPAAPNFTLNLLPVPSLSLHAALVMAGSLVGVTAPALYVDLQVDSEPGEHWQRFEHGVLWQLFQVLTLMHPLY